MRKNIAKLFILLTALVAVLVVTTETQAQRRQRINNRLAKAEVDRIIKRAEQRSDSFVRQFDRALDRSRLDDTRREDQLNRYARRLETNLDELRREFDRSDDWEDNRPEVRRCLDVARDINDVMERRRFGNLIERNWANLRAELNALARVYGLRQIR
jgi:hypothetical protein